MKFKLKKLVRVRSRQRDVAAASHAREQQKRDAAESARDAAHEAIRELTSGQELSAAELERLGSVLVWTETELSAANERVDAARTDLAEASVALRRSEKLEAKVREQTRKETEKREQAANDDRSGHRRGAA